MVKSSVDELARPWDIPRRTLSVSAASTASLLGMLNFAVVMLLCRLGWSRCNASYQENRYGRLLNITLAAGQYSASSPTSLWRSLSFPS